MLQGSYKWVLDCGAENFSRARGSAVSGCLCCNYFRQRDSDRSFPRLAGSSQEVQMPLEGGGRTRKWWRDYEGVSAAFGWFVNREDWWKLGSWWNWLNRYLFSLFPLRIQQRESKTCFMLPFQEVQIVWVLGDRASSCHFLNHLVCLDGWEFKTNGHTYTDTHMHKNKAKLLWWCHF